MLTCPFCSTSNSNDTPPSGTLLPNPIKVAATPSTTAISRRQKNKSTRKNERRKTKSAAAAGEAAKGIDDRAEEEEEEHFASLLSSTKRVKALFLHFFVRSFQDFSRSSINERHCGKDAVTLEGFLFSERLHRHFSTFSPSSEKAEDFGVSLLVLWTCTISLVTLCLRSSSKAPCLPKRLRNSKSTEIVMGIGEGIEKRTS
jgi:hypothetical protein